MKTLKHAVVAGLLCCFGTGVFAADLAVEKLACATAMEMLMHKAYRVGRAYQVEGHRAFHLYSPNPAYATSCYVDGAQLMWRTDKSPSHTSPGRWRTDPYDEVLTWSLANHKLTVTMTFSDKSSTSKTVDVR